MTVAMAPQKVVAANSTVPGGVRFTESFVQYDVSAKNPDALANLAKALAGNLHRPDLTFRDEMQVERELGDVLTSVDLSNPGEIVLQHIETAGKGQLGRLYESMSYVVRNPLTTLGMKVFGVVADPEKLYLRRVVQMLAALEQDGIFGPPGASTLNLSDWKIETRDAWRDVVISRKADEIAEKERIDNDPLRNVSFSEVLRAAARVPHV